MSGRRPPDSHLVLRRELLDAVALQRTLRRLAHEVVEKNGGVASLVLVGIRTGGAHLAARLAHLIADAEGQAPALGVLDITLYRDDVFSGLPRPVIGPSEIPGHSLAGLKVVLVDDVLFTGRTVRAALDALMDFGRPRKVELLVLVDRGRRELPIQPDYVGLTVATGEDESVRVDLVESDGVDRATLRRRAAEPQP